MDLTSICRRAGLAALVLLACCSKGRNDAHDGVVRVNPSQQGLYSPPATTSVDLAGVVAIRCTATPRAEEPVGVVAAGGFPGLYRRDFELTECTAVRGRLDAEVRAIHGYTTLAPLQRVDEPLRPTLALDGGRTFDRPAAGPVPMLVLVGGPAVIAPMGFQGRVATLVDVAGVDLAAPVRAFSLTGADVGLATALSTLVGWQPARSVATASAARASGHAMVAIDALRVAVADGAIDQVELLAVDLLDPSRPAAVRVAAIELVGAAIAAAPVGSAQADRLITAAVGGWEAERRAHVDTAYASALRLTVPQLRGSAQLARARALAVDHQIGQLTQLLHQLAADLE